MTLPELSDLFSRADEFEDERFYAVPRKVVHIDDNAIATLTELFTEQLKEGDAVLDLMSAWRSHLPEDMTFAKVVGHGMNSEEMDDNPQLTEHFVQNLNRTAKLDLPSNSFDAVVCTVSVQYLTQPASVFAEVYRVLKPNGVFIVSFSNRYFSQKAVAIWTQTSDAEHIALVAKYFSASGDWKALQTRIKDIANFDPLYMVWAQKSEPPAKP